MAEIFWGYPRADGGAGVRNRLLMLSVNGLVAAAARRAAGAVAGALLVATPYGRGQIGDDKAMHARQLVGLGRNPNVGAVLVIGADRVTVDRIAGAIAESGKPVDSVALDDVHEDALALSVAAIRKGARLARAISELRRERLPAARLALGVECGHSDATSGLAANPVAGRAVDRLIDAGGTAMFGETLEWLGAEQVLAARAATPAIGRAIVAAVARREANVVAQGVDLTGNNPGAENIRGGLSSIEEKSLGAVAKGGSRAINGVLGLAERPAGAGLWVMDGPGFSPESLTGFAAAGAALMFFTTGEGNSYVDALAPTIKISGHPETARRLPEQIDFDASGVIAGTEDVVAAGDRLWRLALEIASGTRTWGEILAEGDATFVRTGASI